MKIKMLKLGTDIDESLNTRIRGIISTDDKKYLFLELERGCSPTRKYMGLETQEYNEKYPNENYIFVSDCFRVDKPVDYYESYTPELEEYDRKPFYNIAYNKEGIIQLLQLFNKSIDDIELTKENYLDKLCSEKGFFKLYDSRLKHSYTPIEIKRCELRENENVVYKNLYTYYSANGEKFTMEMESQRSIKYLIKEYGKDAIKKLLNEYTAKKLLIIKPEMIEKYENMQNELFEKSCKEAIEELQEETIDI